MTDPRARNLSQVGLSIFCLLLLFYTYVHQNAKDQIALSRLDLLYSLVLHGESYIDRYHGNTIDKAIYGGHYYCDKAPLTTMLALPAFVAAMGLEKALNVDPESPRGWAVASWITCVGSLGIITALGGLITFRLLRLWVGMRIAWICSLGVYLGGAPFPYATALFSQALTVSLLTFALFLFVAQQPALPIFQSGEEPVTLEANSVWFSNLCGFCCGLAVAAEYSAGLVALLLIVSNLLLGFKKFAAACIGAVVGTLPIPVYHILCFGTPFTIAYQHEAQHFPEMREGFFGIHFPPPANVIVRELFGLDCGLLFWTPLLGLSVIGFIYFFRRAKTFATSCGIICLLHLSVMAGYTYLFADGTIAARLLAPIIPLLIIPTALGAARFPVTGCVLAVLSVLLTGGATVINIGFSGRENPWLDYYWPALLKREFAPNFGKVLGLSGGWSLLPLLAIGFGVVSLLLRLTRKNNAIVQTKHD